MLHEQVEDLVLTRRQVNALAAAGERPALRVEQPGAEGQADNRLHAADLSGAPARPT